MNKNLLDKGWTLIRDKLHATNRKLLYLALSGSHAWGLEHPDSDIDIRGIYQDDTLKILGLHKGRDTIEFTDGIYDVQLYEIEKFLNMLTRHNGNMVNLLWLPPIVKDTSVIPWNDLARQFLTKKLKLYYRGYAEAQRKRAMSQRGGKALVYTYREIFSGIYVMHYGKVEHNFRELWNTMIKMGWYQGDLLSKYFPDISQEVTDEGWHRFYSEWRDLCTVLDSEVEQSPLPEIYDGVAECTKLLQSLRVSSLAASSGVQWITRRKRLNL